MEFEDIGGTRVGSPGRIGAGWRPAPSSGGLTDHRSRAIVGIAAGLFALVCGARLIWIDSDQPIMFLQILPITLIAMRFGRLHGLAAGGLALGMWCIAGSLQTDGLIDAPSLMIQLVAFVCLGFAVGWLSDTDRANLARLAQSERDFRFIAEDSVDMISTHAPNGDYTFVSNSVRDLLGYGPDELVGRSSYVFFHPDDVPTIEGSHAETLIGPDVVRTTYRLRHAEGHHIWVETKSKTNRRGASGEVETIQCITRAASEDDTVREIARRDETATRERIERCIGTGGPSIVYQPIIDLEQGAVAAIEALSRFPFAGSGRTPDIWFDDAWRVGRGLDLELLAIERALPALSLIPAGWALTINASPLTVQSPRLLDLLRSNGERVIVELTEHASVKDVGAFVAAVTDLKAIGTRLAIDDVGAGFAGLSRLLDLDPDIIKLDLGITRHIDSDPKRQALTSAFVAFAEEAGILLVAEGVETREEETALRERGVGLAQGYRFAKPMELDALISTVPVGVGST
jgi:PAS domain S-box-containing protein